MVNSRHKQTTSNDQMELHFSLQSIAGCGHPFNFCVSENHDETIQTVRAQGLRGYSFVITIYLIYTCPDAKQLYYDGFRIASLPSPSLFSSNNLLLSRLKTFKNSVKCSFFFLWLSFKNIKLSFLIRFIIY